MSIKAVTIVLACLLIPTPPCRAQLLGEPQQVEQATQNRPNADAAKPEDKERRAELEKKALAVAEQALKDGQSLRLPENRIRLQAMAGDVFWDRDQKRARALFKQATDGLVEIQRNEERSTRPGPDFEGVGVSTEFMQNQLVNQSRMQLRQEVLSIVSRHDARLALEFLRATKSAPVDPGASNQLAYADRFLELNLASQIADNDPDEALKIGEKTLETGFTYELSTLVGRLATKDKDAAGKLASEIVDKLRSEDFAKSEMASSVALSLLRTAIGNGDGSNENNNASQKAALDENIVRDLIEIIVSAALKPAVAASSSGGDSEDDDDDDSSGSQLLAGLRPLLPDIQRYDSTRGAALKARLDEMDKSASPQAKEEAQYEKLAATGTADQLMEAAAKAPAQQKDTLYSQAATKALAEGDADRARQIASEHISDLNRQRAILGSINQQSLWTSVAQGKLDEARPMLARMAPDQRASALINFANNFLSRGDKKTALQLIEEARELIGPEPNSFARVQTQIALAISYATFDSSSSFQLLEPLIDQFNNLLSALQTIDGFEYARNFRDGELMTQSSSQIVNQSFQCARLLSSLSRDDFDRAKACAERFQRTELRVTALMSVAQGVLTRRLQNGGMNMTAPGQQVVVTRGAAAGGDSR